MPSLLKRLARLGPYLATSRTGLLVAALGAVASAATEPMVGELLRVLLDKGFQPGGLALWQVPAAIIGLFAVRSIAGFVSQYGLAWAGQRALLQLRGELFDWLLRCAPLQMTRHSASSVTNTLVYEAQTGATLLTGSLLTLVRDSLTLVALLAYLLTLNWRLTLLVALLFPMVALLMRVLGRRLHRLTVEGQAATDALAYVVEENVLTWRVVRLYGAQAVQAARFRGQADRVRSLMLRAVVAGGVMTPLTQMLAACALSVVIMLAMAQGRSGATTVGEFVAFVSAMLQLVSPAKHLSDVMAPLTRGLAAIERALDLVHDDGVERGGSYRGGHGDATPPARPATADTRADTDAARDAAPPLPRARGAIALHDVTLAYRDDASAPALAGVTLSVQPGETVALVGPSGAGKTSLVNLLPRFVEPSSGRIELDGVALPDWDLAALRRQFALVSQDVVLFNDTLAANVALGRAMPRETVREALRAANLLDFADTLPHGLETPIGHNGSQLSGGQRQRLAIARAIAHDAPVLILDEATSALDTESERAVQQALERLMRGRTTLVIAHRLSTIEHADRVLVMDAGRIAEQGTHAALLAQGGLYARLHAVHFST